MPEIYNIYKHIDEVYIVIHNDVQWWKSIQVIISKSWILTFIVEILPTRTSRNSTAENDD